MKFGSTVTSIWRVTARYMRLNPVLSARDPTSPGLADHARTGAIIANWSAGTNRLPGLCKAKPRPGSFIADST